jgi:hypothetical protein
LPLDYAVHVSSSLTVEIDCGHLYDCWLNTFIPTRSVKTREGINS